MVRYFRHQEDAWTLRDDIRQMVEFRHMNLAGHWPLFTTFDVIFLRNVMIYMDLETRMKILRGIRRHLAPNGYLLLGSTENLLQTPAGFVPVEIDGSVFYRPSPESTR